MSETTLHRIRHTPLRDLARGRLTAALDWRRTLAASGLPAAEQVIVVAVVRRTRLWRAEQAGVARELIAHFQDAADAVRVGRPRDADDDPAARFGDVRQAARLIRRAKLRQRAWTWHARRWAWRGVGVAVVGYAIAAVSFYTGRPRPTVDFVAELNRPVLAVDEADRAWPLYVRARRELALDTTGDDKAMSAFQEAVSEPADGPHAAALAAWIAAHQPGIDTLRRAAAKPHLGFVFGPDGSARDVLNMKSMSSAHGLGMMIEILLPYLNDARVFAQHLIGDARVAAANGDGKRFVADITALDQIAGQMRSAAPLTISGLISVGIRGQTATCVAETLRDRPGALDDAAWTGLAHQLSRPRVAGDLLDVHAERWMIGDFIQRMYTDDGHGDGRLTGQGVALLRRFVVSVPPFFPIAPNDRWLELCIGPAQMLIEPSRKTVLAETGRYYDAVAAQLDRPLRESDPADSAVVEAMKVTPLRFGLLSGLLPAMGGVGVSAERYLGRRDGVVVAIALELYRRRHGDYPATLSDLTPEFLPAVPADRITGGPVRYTRVDGRPVIYSVGVDRVDDGGRLPRASNGEARDADVTALWTPMPGTAPRGLRGDWILYTAAPARPMAATPSTALPAR